MTLFPKYVTSVKMRNILLVVVLWLCAENACVVKGQDCSFSQDTIYINDTSVGEEIANIVVLSTAQYESFYVQDTLSAVDTTIAKKYFEFEKVDDTHLSFKTTADFKDLGSDADSNGAELIVMTLYVSLKCGNISTDSPVIVAITCLFKNEPTFSTTTYSYSVPIPIMQKTDITVYGNEITVTDTNFANTAMTFTIVPDDFEIAASKIDNKHFKAVFSAKNILQFYGDKTYTLTAENTGKQKNSVEITMAPDAKTSLDSPSFKDSYYYFDYDGGTSMTPSNGDIVINSNKANEATLMLEGENSAYFTIKLDNSSKTLSLSSDGNLPLDATSRIILSLSFTTDSTAKTTLLINVAPVIPKFSNKHYSGTFDVNSKEIAWKEEIGIEDATSVAIIEQSSLFSIDQTTYKITPSGDLSKSDFDESLNIIFTVVATSSTSNKSEAAVVISLKTETVDALEFDNTYYTATYAKENGEWVVNLNSGIGFVDISDFSGIEIQVDEAYSSNFKLEQDSLKWKVSILSPLTNEVLNNNRKLAIPLTASKTGLQSTIAVLILTLPDKVEINFGSLYYSGSYVQGPEKDAVVLTKEIEITGADAADVTIIVEEYQDYLHLEHDSGSSYKLTVKQNLNSTALNSKSPLLIIIAASTETSVAHTTIVLDLPDQSLQLKFEKPFYHAIYSEERIVLDDASINLIKTDTLKVQFSCEGYDENFELTQDSAGDSYYIRVKSPLNETSISQLSILITAFNTDSDISASTVLVISLPQESQALRFAEPYYSASYSVDGSKGVVTLTEEMQLIGADDLTVSFYVNEFQDYLKIDSVSGSSYTISVIQDLNSTALNHKSPLLIVIAATTETSVAYTTLVLDLPDQSLQLEFEKPFYRATYSNGKLVLDDDSIIVIKTDTLDVQLLCEGYDDNFELTKDSTGDSYTITVKSPLNDTSMSQLSILIRAFDTDSDISASTVLVITLPQDSQAFKFAKPYYSASYSVVDSKGLVTITEAMQLIGADDLTVTFFVNGYDDNLKIESDSESSCTISVSKILNSTVLDYKSPLLIIISASTETSVAYTTLVLDLPDKSLQLEFEKQFYHATYSIDEQNRGTIIVDDGGINIIKTDGLEVLLMCEGYEKYLELTQDSATGSYSITVKNPLNETVVYLNTQVSILIKAVSSASKISTTAVVVLDLPSLEVFSTDQFVAEYQLSSDGNKYDIRFIGEAIKVTSTIFNQISFTGYENNFKATCSATGECSVIVENNLSSTILNLNDELIINLAATNEDSSSTKTAVLLLKLPFKSFAKDIYSGTYSVDEGSISNVGDITVSNIDTSLVDVKLKDYSEYFLLKPSDNKWTIEVINVLPSEITSKQETLVTNLLAVRTSDQKTLAISTLQILLPKNIPKFEKFTYYGTYENSVDPAVKLEDKISLAADSLPASKIFIDPKDEYVEYFDLSASKEELLVNKPLGEDILEIVTSIALTLQAESEGGTYGHATIVISLPKKLRDSSVEVENQQVLFTGTYQDGSFKSPSITLNTNATTDEDILVEISNDLGLDSALYFSYKYSSQVLTITTIAELPDDFLKSNKVLPLKLAIKDKSTKDTVYAVLNVDLSSNSNDDKGDSSKGVRTGLIVAVSILAVLLLLVLLAAFLFWFFKLRENHGVEITPEEALVPAKTNTFKKNEVKMPVMVSNPLRRPTGIAIGLNPISQGESLTDDEHLKSVEPEAEKKVAFDENVEKIDNEVDDDDNEDNEDSETMQSVADRRPTKFVFGYPLELGVPSLSDKEDENGNLSDIETTNGKSTDSSNGVKKKGVAFDQNVERIDIEIDEGQESDTEKSENA